MTLQELARHRLALQQISGTKFKEPAQVVSWLGAIQAQDYAGAKWSIGLRLPEATDVDIERAITDRTLVRTWPMRGTLHFVAPADIRWMLALLTPRIVAAGQPRYQQLGLDEATFARGKKLFAKALQGGKQLTREEMYALLERASISTEGQRGYHVLGRAAQDGLICFGPVRGKQQTFVLLDEWVPETRKWERDEALVELTKRYFTGHGPATLNDFAGWTGLKVSDARAGLDMAGSELARETLDGTVYWMPRAMPALRQASSTAHLLPGFDEYILGYKDRAAVIESRHASKLAPGKNGMFNPTIVIDGQVVGTWKRTLKKKAVVVVLSPFAPLSKAEQRAVAAAAEPYGRFVGLPVELSSAA